jgi:hypothetical protein
LTGPAGPLTAAADPAWVAAVQRAAGNRAVAEALAQRIEPAAAPAPAPATSAEGTPGRVPRPDEVDHLLGVLPDLTEFRILRENSTQYNCFAWAIGDDTSIVGSRSQSGLYKDDHVDSWTDWLRKSHGFGRFVDGFDPAADLLLYGSAGWIEHAARKAEVPYGRLTFSSKLGGGNTASPVIQHDPHEIEGKQYGRIVRSLWRAPAPPAP